MSIPQENLILLDSFIDSYIDFSINTTRSYRSTMLNFFKQCPYPAPSITSEQIMKWLITNCYNRLKPSALNKTISILKQFFGFCITQGLREDNPVQKYWTIKIKPGSPRYLNQEQSAKFRVTIDNLPTRNRLIMTFLTETGIRRSSLVAINVDDINIVKKEATIYGKGDKEHVIDISEKVIFLMKKYLSERQSSSEALFLNKNKERLNDRSVYNIVSPILRNLGFKTLSGPHTLRHDVAQKLLSKGYSLEDVANLFDHEDIETTVKYSAVPNDEFVKKHLKFLG